MYYIGLDVHKKTISYCVKDASGQVYREGTIGATRNELWLFSESTFPVEFSFLYTTRSSSDLTFKQSIP
jgi:hypothetical protein